MISNLFHTAALVSMALAANDPVPQRNAVSSANSKLTVELALLTSPVTAPSDRRSDLPTSSRIVVNKGVPIGIRLTFHNQGTQTFEIYDEHEAMIPTRIYVRDPKGSESELITPEWHRVRESSECALQAGVPIVLKPGDMSTYETFVLGSVNSTNGTKTIALAFAELGRYELYCAYTCIADRSTVRSDTVVAEVTGVLANLEMLRTQGLLEAVDGSLEGTLTDRDAKRERITELLKDDPNSPYKPWIEAWKAEKTKREQQAASKAK